MCWHLVTRSHCNKLSLKSVHCSRPPAARRAFPSLSPVFPITLKQIGWEQKPASAGTSGLAAPLGSHHQAGHTASVAHMAEVPQLTPEWDDPSVHRIKAGPPPAHIWQPASPTASTSMWLWLPFLPCLFRENDFHSTALSEQVAHQIRPCFFFFFFGCCSVCLESLPCSFLCNFIKSGCQVVILVSVEHLCMLLSRFCFSCMFECLKYCWKDNFFFSTHLSFFCSKSFALKKPLFSGLRTGGGEESCCSCSHLKGWDEDLHEPQRRPCYYKIKPTLNWSTETTPSNLLCKKPPKPRW